MMVAFGAVHGNEPSGVLALRQVFTQLREEAIPLQGQLVGVVGNLSAFQRAVRYRDADLNRLFLDEYVAQVRSDTVDTIAEHEELLDICRLVEEYESRSDGQPFFVDCHTTSAASVPYISMNEGYADSYRFAQGIPAATVIGVEREIKGCLAEWLNTRGWHGFTLEAGQHQADTAVRNQAAVIWLGLWRAGCLQEQDAPTILEQARNTLRQQSHQQDQAYRVTSSYRIGQGEDFRMMPGFINLQAVQQGEHLATSDGRHIYAEHNGFILMPLYQPQGSFGFFMAEEVPQFSLLD